MQTGIIEVFICTSAYEHFNDTHLHMVGMQTLHTKCCGSKDHENSEAFAEICLSLAPRYSLVLSYFYFSISFRFHNADDCGRLLNTIAYRLLMRQCM